MLQTLRKLSVSWKSRSNKYFNDKKNLTSLYRTAEDMDIVIKKLNPKKSQVLLQLPKTVTISENVILLQTIFSPKTRKQHQLDQMLREKDAKNFKLVLKNLWKYENWNCQKSGSFSCKIQTINSFLNETLHTEIIAIPFFHNINWILGKSFWSCHVSHGHSHTT